MPRSRLCIFTPYPLEAALLAYVLESEFELETLQAHTEEEAVRCAHRATMLIIHEAGPELDRLPLVRNVVRANPQIAIVVLEAGDGLGTLAYLQAGTTVYLGKDATVQDLLEKVRAAQKGEVALSPQMTAEVVHRLQELASLNLDEEVDLSRCERLTRREQDIARELSAQRSNAEIAEALGIALGTVKSHVHTVMKKLDVDSRRLAGIYWRIHEHAAERDAG
jgi:DNA-binding NarL/FixJ family response regulator